jgi:UDP-N-acetylmuramate: L-alanyl-gamma-D-glutamyl-meso-diaminopimelate ligase
MRIYFIGICGTGMAPLAAMLQTLGHDISGSDEAVYPPMSEFLAERKIPVYPGFKISHFEPKPDLVIVGNALSRGNPEIEYMLNYKIPYVSMPEALKTFFLREKTPVVVTGTHGKTTTSSMIAWVLHHAGARPNFWIGGIAENFQSSYGLEGGRCFVVEGDEYDSAFFDKGPKFLHYLPEVAVIGNIEYDHADIYPDLGAIRLQFERFVHLIPQRGYLAVGAESPIALEASARAFCERETFGLDGPFDWSVRDVRAEDGRTSFDALYQGKLYRRISLGMIGAFNIRNALAAAAVLHRLGIAEDDVREGLASFRGVRRRLQIVAEIAGIRILEDFAHHPTAVRQTLLAVRESYRPARLWAIYEPRSATSRRRVFQREIAEALSIADCIAIPALYRPDKVPEGERLDPDRLIADLESAGRAAWNLGDVDGIIRKVCREARAGDWIVILSNGGFGGIYQRLPEALGSRSSRKSSVGDDVPS